MNKTINILISRGFIIIIGLILQITFFSLVFTVFKNHKELLIFLMSLLSIYLTLKIIISDIYPEHKIAWIIFMFIMPITGGMFYLLYGKITFSKKKINLYKRIIDLKEKEINQLTLPNLDELNEFQRQAQYLYDASGSPYFSNTSVKYLKLGEVMLEELLVELSKAKKFIFIESFIIEEGKMWGQIEEVLIKKAKEGVLIRVLFDDAGCLLTLPSNFVSRLKQQNINCVIFNKITSLNNAKFNNRDHRKIIVIDGNVGFNGGINLADEYINHVVKHGHWKDTAVMLKGEAVYGLTLLFLEMWMIETNELENISKYKPTISEKKDGIIQPFGDNPMDHESVGETIYMSILGQAQKYVYITSPYLIITSQMERALKNAAKAGVEVVICLPKHPDKKFVQFLSRSYYRSLLNSGVKIYEYTPGFIHSKMFITDDNKAIVGTINLDYRSLDLHYECGTFIANCSVIKDIKEDYLDIIKVSEEVTLNSPIIKKQLSFFQFIILAILKTFSPLL